MDYAETAMANQATNKAAYHNMSASSVLGATQVSPLSDCEMSAKEARDRICKIHDRLSGVVDALIGSRPEADTANGSQMASNGRLSDLRNIIYGTNSRLSEIESVLSRLEQAVN